MLSWLGTARVRHKNLVCEEHLPTDNEFSKCAAVSTHPIDEFIKDRENVFMFLRTKSRIKDGKTHRYWGVVENRRVASGGVLQQQMIYLWKLNDKNYLSRLLRSRSSYFNTVSSCSRVSIDPGLLLRTSVMASIPRLPLLTR